MSQDAEPNTDSRGSAGRSIGPWGRPAPGRSAASGQILAAARELTEETGGLDFTVQDIVDRSGLSLRSFYKHFGGKDELLLALLEELLRDFADDMRRDVEALRRPGRPAPRLRHQLPHAGPHLVVPRWSGVQRLPRAHARVPPRRVRRGARATGAAAAGDRRGGHGPGRIRTDLSATDVTGLLTVTLMSAAQMSLLDVELTESPLQPDQLWAWCAAAVGEDRSPVATGPAVTRATKPGQPATPAEGKAAGPSRRPPPAARTPPADDPASVGVAAVGRVITSFSHSSAPLAHAGRPEQRIASRCRGGRRHDSDHRRSVCDRAGRGAHAHRRRARRGRAGQDASTTSTRPPKRCSARWPTRGAEDMERAIAAARRAFDETDWSTDRAFRKQCLRAAAGGAS